MRPIIYKILLKANMHEFVEKAVKVKEQASGRTYGHRTVISSSAPSLGMLRYVRKTFDYRALLFFFLNLWLCMCHSVVGSIHADCWRPRAIELISGYSSSVKLTSQGKYAQNRSWWSIPVGCVQGGLCDFVPGFPDMVDYWKEDGGSWVSLLSW